jgi:hypothetical protein
MMVRPSADPAALLAKAIAQHTQCCSFQLGQLRTRPWASATFEGERVEIELHGVEPRAAWLAKLPEIELKVRRYYVADLAVHATGPSSVRVEALLLLDL